MASPLAPYKQSFLHTCLTSSILRFGTFTLKSGRTSPYFFNAGAFHTSSLLSSLAIAYAQAILTNLLPTTADSLPFDVIFGPAYKGIPLAAIAALKLGELEPRAAGIGYCFNRKEAKDHGEGGVIVGMDPKGKRVLIVDDVITAGTAIRESVALIRKLGGVVVGIVVALDRMETVVGREEKGKSAIAEVKGEVGCGVWSILSLEDLVEGKDGDGLVGAEQKRRMREYREKYGAREV
ncbi:phosphoribosyltransferase-like protein [Terfezia claveryi]|nr:phosphoribosyltransferase-like protein [Terfezia claveryi]